MRLLAIWTAAAAFSGLVTACAAPETLNPNLGNAVRHNMAVHIINPDPRLPDLAGPEMSGRRAAKAAERYHEGVVIEPERIETSRPGKGIAN
jgi:hypothetical protein